ncbi:DUF2730 family protein [Guyparkeria halophila]|uniref:DUF2730 family protein n=1 Tax=Guyparkeria halophila TaxID=47960 RepID=A0ABZ0YVG5_9GAMM|nr:DUF2730 family protein [Guyparkeria halophila]WQH16154.1 DUF2730 family protein [Guyparkeria halophila]
MALENLTFGDVMQGVNAIGVVAVGIYTWLISRSVANRDAIDKQAAHQAEADRRIDRLESVADHAPTHQDLAELHARINDLSGAVNKLVGVMGAVERSLSRVEDKLIREDK